MIPALLTLDIGTSSVKAGVFEIPGGKTVWLHRETLSGTSGGSGRAWVVDRWVSAVQAIIDQLPVDIEIGGVALSGNGPTIVPVAADGSAIRDALLWMDEQGARLASTNSFFLPKIGWLDAERREGSARAWMYMTCPEYLAFLMGSEPHSTSPSTEFDRYVWTPPEIARYGLDPDRIPPLVRPGERVGSVSERGRQVFGIPATVPIFAAGPDFLMSLLGTATVTPGLTCDRAGTSEGINHCSSGYVDSDVVRCLPHVVPTLWNVAGILASTGRIFEWFRSISRQQSVGYERMLAEIESAGYDHEPYFFPSMHHGAAWEFSRGMFVGLRADHGTAQMGRGVVHSIGYAVRQSIESLRSVGCDVRELRACGGQAKNPVWNQMKADITGVPVVCPEVRDAELVGAACCALAGLGEFASPVDAAGRIVRFTERYDPRPDHHERFSSGFDDYLSTYQTFLDAMARVAGVRG